MFICTHFAIDVLQIDVHVYLWSVYIYYIGNVNLYCANWTREKRALKWNYTNQVFALNSNDVDCRWRCVDKSNAILLVSSLFVPSFWVCFFLSPSFHMYRQSSPYLLCEIFANSHPNCDCCRETHWHLHTNQIITNLSQTCPRKLFSGPHRHFSQYISIWFHGIHCGGKSRHHTKSTHTLYVVVFIFTKYLFAFTLFRIQTGSLPISVD